MRHWLLSFCLLGLAATCAAQKLPAEFDHDRILLVAKSPEGSTLRIYTDSGGGGGRITRATADRLKLASTEEVDDDGHKMTLVEFPRFVLQAGIPTPNPKRGLHDHLIVVPDDSLEVGVDMFLGSTWFSDRVWQIDYPRHELSLVEGYRPGPQDHEIPVGFVSNALGVRQLDFPRITIAVDGEPFDVLLDTGATITTSDQSAAAFQVAPGARVAGSFIAKALFDDWHARHPDWKVIEQGDVLHGKAFALIEVPKVTVAGSEVGPVWFAQRPDGVWKSTGMMGPLMDKEIHGAFGGSGLHWFRIVLDYPRAKAWFRLDRPQTAAAN